MSRLAPKLSLSSAGPLALCGFLLLSSGRAHAVDGVLEINQTCATVSGCFAGDPAGYPIEIVSPGSFRLTSNLILPDPNTTGILVQDNDVTIDLNGFSIIRVGCAGAVASCAPAGGVGDGVNAVGFRRTTVTNGSVIGMGGDGVELGESSQVTKLQASWNRGDGIDVSGESIIAGNTAFENEGDGIETSGSVVVDNAVVGNGLNGIVSGIGSVIENNRIERNGAAGLRETGGATIRGNAVRDNLGAGITAGEGSNVSDNISNANGDDGIIAEAGSLVSRNVARINGGFGLDLHPTTSIRENVINGNALGTINSGLIGIGNSCNGTLVCP
jgi:hypothetical protein